MYFLPDPRVTVNSNQHHADDQAGDQASIGEQRLCTRGQRDIHGTDVCVCESEVAVLQQWLFIGGGGPFARCFVGGLSERDEEEEERARADRFAASQRGMRRMTAAGESLGWRGRSRRRLSGLRFSFKASARVEIDHRARGPGGGGPFLVVAVVVEVCVLHPPLHVHARTRPSFFTARRTCSSRGPFYYQILLPAPPFSLPSPYLSPPLQHVTTLRRPRQPDSPTRARPLAPIRIRPSDRGEDVAHARKGAEGGETMDEAK